MPRMTPTPNAEECEAADSFTPAALALVDDGEGAEEHV